MTSARATGAGRAWQKVRDATRTQLWPIPTGGVLIALALGIALPRIDAASHETVSERLSFVFTGGADSARSVLEAVAGSLITVTSLTFSLTVVTLQLASSQFSPRLLRTFTRDLVVQGTLALFLGTFTYALTVLRTVRTAADGRAEFVPNISVTVGFLLALISVVGLVLFLAHLTRTIRVESMLRSVHDTASATAAAELAISTEPPFSIIGLPPQGRFRPLLSDAAGFVVSVDEASILRAAIEADAVVLLDCAPGGAIVADVPIGAMWSAAANGSLDDATAETLSVAVRDAIRTGFERTSAQDLSLGLRQLADVALKALSPGINDPTTAVHALGRSSALLAELAGREIGSRALRDEDNAVRVVLVRPDLADLLELAVAQPARYATESPPVMCRLFTLLAELGWTCRLHQREAVGAEVARLRRLVAAGDLDPADRAALDEAAQRAELALVGTWTFGGRQTL